MSSALTHTCCGYSAIAPTQRISLSDSAAAAHPGHDHRRQQPAAPFEYSYSRLGFLGRQQPGGHNGAAQALEGQPEEIEARRCRLDQPRTLLTANVGEAGGF